MKAPPAIHLHLGIPTHTKGKPKMLGSSTLSHPSDNFFGKKKKKHHPIPKKNKKKQFSCFHFFTCKEKISWRFWDTWIQRGNWQPTIPSLYKLASSNPHPQVPRTIASSVTSRCESLLLFVGFNRFNPQRGSKFWGIFTTYKYPKLPIQD